MSLKNKHHKEMIVKYHQNKLSNSERHQLELEALDDPFLDDALEGFELYPNSAQMQEIEMEIIKRSTNNGSSSFYTLFIAPALVLIGLSLVFNPMFKKNNAVVTQSKHHVIAAENISTLASSNNEVIIINEAQINTAQKLPKKEWLENISKSETKDVEDKNIITPAPIELAKIDTPIEVIDQKETTVQLKKYNHPVYFLYDYKVANYRNFRSGDLWTDNFNNSVSAQHENESTVNNVIENNKVSYADFLKDCMKSYSNGKLKLSLRGYKTILTNYPDDANALFYSGLTSYNLGFTEGAITLLEKSYNHPYGVFKEESEWFWALSLLKNGDNKKSLEIMQSIANSDHFYSDRALKKIAKIEEH